MNTVSVTDLRQDATNILNRVVATQEPTYIIQNSKTQVVILDAEYYGALQEALEDYLDGLDAQEALKESGSITIEEYAKKRWGKNYASLYHPNRSKRTKSPTK